MAETPSHPVKLLAQGICGLSEVELISEFVVRLEHTIDAPETPKPCECFDLVAHFLRPIEQERKVDHERGLLGFARLYLIICTLLLVRTHHHSRQHILPDISYAGGIRGLSEVDILNDMMYRLQYDEGEPEMPKPCERFDLIGGSGTGGLLAVLIGPLKLSVPVVYEIYLKIVRAAFSRVNGWPRPPPAADEEPRVNDPPHLVPLLKDIVRDALQDEDALMIDSSRGDQCKVFVCLHMLHTHPHPRLIRTYETNETDSTNYRIWEVLRATLSCPGILNVFDPKAQTFTDMATSQSLRGCNPSALVLQEAQAVFPQRTLSCLVNLGCGHVGSNETFSPAEEFVQIIGRECDRAAEDMVRATKDLVELETEWRRRKGLPSLRTDNPGLRRAPATFYHRFSVVLDFQKLGIAEWEVFADVIAVTRQYLLEHEPNSNLNRIVAESLIGKKPWILLGPPESTAM